MELHMTQELLIWPTPELTFKTFLPFISKKILD